MHASPCHIIKYDMQYSNHCEKSGRISLIMRHWIHKPVSTGRWQSTSATQHAPCQNPSNNLNSRHNRLATGKAHQAMVTQGGINLNRLQVKPVPIHNHQSPRKCHNEAIPAYWPAYTMGLNTAQASLDNRQLVSTCNQSWQWPVKQWPVNPS